MAHLLLPLNGIGRGHLTRALVFAEWLLEAGRRPMVALQGACPYSAFPSIPVTHVPTLHGIAPERAQRFADDLARIALLSEPAVIVEDTHPRRVIWPAGIRHVIVVRPTIIDHMRLLQQLHGETGARLLICDHPASPTWPYDEAETREIGSWSNWDFLGPVFRTATPEGLARVREKYRLLPNEDLFVFSMGGGGEMEGSGDRVAFVETAGALVEQLRSLVRNPRFVFVRGPLFPPALDLPGVFEDVSEEPDLASLFGLATGAVIRPGYNVTWECIAAGTPFIPLRSTTCREPVQARLDALAARGFETSRDPGRLVDPAARERFAAARSEVLARFTGSPREIFLAHAGAARPLVAKPVPLRQLANARSFAAEQLQRLACTLREGVGPMPLRIRLDDVTRLDEEVCWLIALCRELGLKPSLEVVPYHNDITGEALDRLDPDGAVDVAQHGYAHLPQYREGGEVRGELVHAAEGHAGEQLRLGAKLLESTFGPRFRGGYSAPYDVPPGWLARVWRAAGGRYISWIWRRPEGDALPSVRLGVDPWDWKAGDSHEPERVIERILSTMARDTGVGLVFHPHCLRDAAHRQMSTDLLHCLATAGCVPVRIDPAASTPGSTPSE